MNIQLGLRTIVGQYLTDLMRIFQMDQFLKQQRKNYWATNASWPGHTIGG